MYRRYTLVIMVCLLIMLTFVGIVYGSNAIGIYTIRWAIISGGGGSGMITSDRYAIQNTIGQVSISSSVGQYHRVDHGIWYGLSNTQKLYLPVALRDH